MCLSSYMSFFVYVLFRVSSVCIPLCVSLSPYMSSSRYISLCVYPPPYVFSSVHIPSMCVHFCMFSSIYVPLYVYFPMCVILYLCPPPGVSSSGCVFLRIWGVSFFGVVFYVFFSSCLFSSRYIILYVYFPLSLSLSVCEVCPSLHVAFFVFVFFCI